MNEGSQKTTELCRRIANGEVGVLTGTFTATEGFACSSPAWEGCWSKIWRRHREGSADRNSDGLENDGDGAEERATASEDLTFKGREAGRVNCRFGKPVALLTAALLWAGFVGSGMAEFVTDVLSSASGFAGLSRTREQFGALVMAGLVLGTNVVVIRDENGTEKGTADISPFVPTIAKHLLAQSHSHSWLTLNGTYRHVRFNEQIEVVGKSLLCAQVSSNNDTNPQFTAIDLGARKSQIRIERKERNGLFAFGGTTARKEDQEQNSAAFNEWCLPLDSELETKTEGFIDELLWLRTGPLEYGFGADSELINSFRNGLSNYHKDHRTMHLEGLKAQSGQYHLIHITQLPSNCTPSLVVEQNRNASKTHRGISAVADIIFQSELSNNWTECVGTLSSETGCFGYELVPGRENLGET